MKKNFPKESGLIALPLVLGGVVLIVLISSIVWLANREKTGSTQTAKQTVTASPNSTANLPNKSHLTWGGINPGVYERTVDAGGERVEPISFSGRGAAVVKVNTSDTKMRVALQDENGVNVTDNASVKQTAVKQADGSLTYLFQIPSTAKNKDWQLVVTNQNPNSPSTYDLTLAEAPQVAANSQSGNQNNFAGASASLSLTLQETIALNVTIPVIDATVVANITDPNNQTSSVTLTESTTNPGTYTGTFDNVSTPGTYEVVYVISGNNVEGEHFDQVVNDSFVVPDPNVVIPNDNTTYSSSKKYDINQANDIRPVQ